MGGVGNLLSDLQRHPLVAVDTMVFIYLLEDHPRYASIAAEVLSAIEQGKVKGVIGSITITELLTAPAQAGDATAMLDYELYLLHFPNITIHPVDVAVAHEAALVRAKSGLPTPDAIVLATARVAGADAVVTNDRRWRGKCPDLQVLLLSEYLEE